MLTTLAPWGSLDTNNFAIGDNSALGDHHLLAVEQRFVK
jgi:hypothetical protein